MKNRLVLGLLGLFLVLTNKSFCHDNGFATWLTSTTKKLEEKGKRVHTALGDMQVVIQGKGPYVLALHGGFGGWDQGELVATGIAKQGFTVIIPSRPGYLSSPIYTDPMLLEETTAAMQADLMAALLDALDIPQVLCLGFSAGAPVAYEFGLRHPDRTKAIVLECIGANPNEDGLFYGLLGGFLVTETQTVDYMTYLLHLSLRYDAASTLCQFLPQDTTLTGKAQRIRNRYVLHHKDQYNFLQDMLKSAIPISPRLLGTLNDFLGVDYWTTTYSPPTLAQYSLPTLIIQAVNDSNGFYPTAQSVHQDLATSQLISVEESGHFIWLGPNSNKWEKKLFRFLENHQ